MAKRKKRKESYNARQRKEGFKYAKSNPLVGAEDIRVIRNNLKRGEAPNKNVSNNDKIIIINGVVCTTGRYSRLYEDYDDK